MCINDADVCIPFVSRQTQFDVAITLKPRCPQFTQIIVLDPTVDLRGGQYA
jgi:long-chain acyl-CoA synthetase